MNVSADSLQVIHFTERQRQDHQNPHVLLPHPVNIVIKGRTSDVMFVVTSCTYVLTAAALLFDKNQLENEVFNGLIKSLIRHDDITRSETISAICVSGRTMRRYNN